jgi:HlyD family secretion protein
MVSPRIARGIAAAAMSFALTGCGTGSAAADKTPKTQAVAQKSPANSAEGVGCLGRILPVDGSFYIAPYTSAGRTPVVDQLKIKAGDDVAAGQIIATLQSRPYLEAAVKEAETQVALAHQRRVRMNSGAMAEEMSVVQAELARVQVQRDAAARDYDRNKPLYDKDFLSKAQLDALETRVHDADALLAQTRARLTAMNKVRPEDNGIAEDEIRVAEAELARARQEVASSVVRAPAKAHVLRILAHAGEAVGPQGIAEMADTSRMAVFAEVYEADIARVHLGQKASITSPLLPGPLTGEVEYIDPQIERQDPISIEPGAPSDARIFKVRLRVPDQGVLAARINGKVDIVIQP